MIQEAYCSFEVSKLFKEKGFNESCYTYYDDIDNSINRFDKGLHFNNTSYPWGVPYDISKAKKYVVAPTHQMAMAWLREVHNLFIEMHIQNNGSYIGYIYNTNGFALVGWDKRRVSGSYEESVEAALKYSLENLI